MRRLNLCSAAHYYDSAVVKAVLLRLREFVQMGFRGDESGVGTSAN
jgi:hypothetical protein